MSAAFEPEPIRALAERFTPGPFKAQVLRLERQRSPRVLVLRHEQGSIQLGAFLFLEVKGTLEALVKIVTLRFEDDGLWVGVRPLFSRALEAAWAKAAPKLKGATALGLTPAQQEFVTRELSEWDARAAALAQAARDDEARAEEDSRSLAVARWTPLVALEPSEAFRTHFAYLLEGPGDELLLRKVAARATGVRLEGERLIFDFGAEARLTGTAPSREPFTRWPSAFRRAVAQHEQLSFPSEGWALVLGEGGAVEPPSALTDFSDWWSYEGSRLRRVSHEGGADRYSELGVGVLFLTRMLELLEEA